jgi:hypothetical protein
MRGSLNRAPPRNPECRNVDERRGKTIRGAKLKNLLWRVLEEPVDALSFPHNCLVSLVRRGIARKDASSTITGAEAVD